MSISYALSIGAVAALFGYLLASAIFLRRF